MTSSWSTPRLVMPSEAAPAIRYDAFISYSHAADGRFAPALRSGLQRFATPWRLFRLTNPVRSLRIFQDTASLSANPELWPTIERALMASEWFVLLASSEAATSPWVGKEVDFWCRHKSPPRLLIVQTAGEITWDGAINDFDWTRTDAIPKVLSGAFRAEPRWVDARFARTEKQVTLRDPRFRDLVAEVAAPLRGIPKDDLIGEDIRQHRRLNFWRNTGVAVLTALLIVATLTAVFAIQQRNQAQYQRNEAQHSLDLVQQAGTGLVGDLAQGLKDVSGVSKDTVRRILRRAEELLNQLVGREDARPKLRQTYFAALDEFAQAYIAQGDLNLALRFAEQAKEVAQTLIQQNPGNAEAQRDLLINHNRIGEVLDAQGNRSGAPQAYQAGLVIAEQLAQQNPGNAEWQRDLALSHDNIGDVLETQGDHSGALRAYQAALDIRQRLAQQNPGNAEWQRDLQRDLAISHTKIGNVLETQGNLSGALQAYQADLDITERLVQQDPDNAKWQRDLSVSHKNIGDVLEAQGDHSGALRAYQAVLDIRQRLARQDPGNAEWQRDLSVSHENVGDALEAQGDHSGALQAYQADLDITERLFQRDPGNTQWQRDQAISHNKIGDVLEAQGDHSGALRAYQAALDIRQRLARQDPCNAQWQRDLALSHDRIGVVLETQGDHSEALPAYQAALEIYQRLVQQKPDNTQWQRGLAWVESRLNEIRAAHPVGQ